MSAEYNNGTGWIANGNLHQGLFGLRVFNVGVTRTASPTASSR
jgi:hypothetical protein